MADQGHIKILKQGVKVWNKWRMDNPDINPDLSEAELRGAKLRGANLRKTVLRNAILVGADLRDADLFDSSLSNVILNDAKLGCADLDHADLSDAKLISADLISANLRSANFIRADLRQAKLEKAQLSSAILNNARLSYAILNNAFLSFVKLREADLSCEVKLSESDLVGADLSYAIFYEADLTKANLSEADITKADFTRADLREAKFYETKFIGASLYFANLQKADFRGSVFSKVNLIGTDLTLADLTAIRIDRETAAQIPDALREKYEHTWIFLKDESVIQRSIEFPPGCHEAGLGILSYFGTIVRQKYKDVKVGVTIKQEGQKVTLIVETPEGEKEKIEKTLEEYGLVVTGNMKPEEFLSDPIEVMELKQKLEIAHTELKLRKELSEFKDKQYGERIVSLEDQVQKLHNCISGVLDQSNKATQLSEEFISLIENHAGIRTELEFLQQKLNSTIEFSATDIREIKETVISIRDKKPKLKQKLADILTSAKGSALWDAVKLLLP